MFRLPGCAPLAETRKGDDLDYEQRIIHPPFDSSGVLLGADVHGLRAVWAGSSLFLSHVYRLGSAAPWFRLADLGELLDRSG